MHSSRMRTTHTLTVFPGALPPGGGGGVGSPPLGGRWSASGPTRRRVGGLPIGGRWTSPPPQNQKKSHISFHAEISRKLLKDIYFPIASHISRITIPELTKM